MIILKYCLSSYYTVHIVAYNILLNLIRQNPLLWDWLLSRPGNQTFLGLLINKHFKICLNNNKII